MKGRLIKTGKLYALEVDDIIATTDNYLSTKLEHLYRLSFKNCEAIELGYDLDELAKADADLRYNQPGEEDLWLTRVTGIEYGFNLALEILGNKKFSEDDVLKVVTHVLNELVLVDGFDKQYLFPESIYQETTTKCKSLQQTEWDVEIEMICPHPMDTYRCGLQYGCDEGGCNHPEQVPYLDADGCLILKRI
ncbi:hypothetical protein UFOVP1307_130 [uncultured Caudovirales phage]|uniref:Uncharacterized protein n=1 Tax=uncultured Caudovirales phage TaxID=2100421 RepID=A0A6J5NCR2_9CAUD|nr:hypothetical protein UFOVP651_216 [uncultured Caudovirales phage]CAB4170635.1 hypothetical protein UFOVP902_72 [uncultured Caudovirales phage]CAB4198519.1 hypothetical protein UFOVP1307_130 [uncultured Caudovirales phage]